MLFRYDDCSFYDFPRILCTHHTQFLMSADVVVLMDNGRIAAMGSPHEVFSHYTHVLANPAATGGPEEEMTSVEINKASDDEVCRYCDEAYF